MTTPARAFLRCPHCDAAAIVRSSVSHNRLLRESMLQCRNALCGHTFTAYTEIVRTISPSVAQALKSACQSAAHQRRPPSRRS